MQKRYSFVKNGKTSFYNRDRYFVDKLDKSLEYITKPIITQSQSKRGISELSFKKYMSNYLNIQFIDNQYEVNFGNVTYYPDIVIEIKVGVNTVYIDIEIDEPYSLDSRPIHYIGSDDFRNSCFEKNK